MAVAINRGDRGKIGLYNGLWESFAQRKREEW
jgi:hypothetical protein